MESPQKDSSSSDTQFDAQGVNLPPDQSLRISISKAENSFLLLSVSDDPILFGKGSQYDDFSNYSNVHIFSENIALTGDLSAQQGISLFCNDITSVSNASVISTGADGEDQKPTVPATSGAQGGPINFYIQSGSSNASAVWFVSTGGDGGDATVEDAQAGNAGDGGHLIRIFQSNCSDLLDSIYNFTTRKDVDPKYYQSSVSKGDPRYRSASDILIVATGLIAAEETVEARIKPLQDQLSTIDKGTPVVTIGDLVTTINWLRNNVTNDVVTKQQDNFTVSVKFGPGEPGAGKGVRAKTGQEGKSGSDTYSFLEKYDSTIRTTTLAFAHPEQCNMLLERAKIFYYMGSHVLQAQAADLFQRIVHRLSFLPLQPTDPLYKAYTDSPIMPSDSLSHLDFIKMNTTTWLTQLLHGATYDGHRKDWIPRPSYTFYTDALNSALADHKAFEDAYINYHAALSQMQELQDSVGLALDQTSQIISGLNVDIDDLNAQLQESDKSITALTGPVTLTHTDLIAEFEKLKDQINDYFGLSMPQLLNALKSFAFGPNKGMAAVQGLDLLYQGFTSVPDLSGNPVNKDVIIGKIQYGEATVESIKDTLGKELDGSFELDDPFGTRIMTAEDSMMSFLDSFVNTSLAKVIKEMKDKFYAFVKAIIARNQEVLHYNVLLKLLVNKFADVATYEKKKDELQGKKIEANDPDLPAITEYMGDIYQSSRARVMKFLDYLLRSLNFRMLTREDIYKLAFADGTEYDKVPLTLTSDVLLNARKQIEDKFDDEINVWGSEPARFPANFDDPRGKRIYLNKDDLQDLITNYTVVVGIPIMYKDTLEKNDFSGCCNVRIYRVRFGFTGLAVKESNPVLVMVNLKHGGEETIVDRLSSGHEFVHDSVTAVYSYNLSSDGSITVEDNGNIGEADVDQFATSYAAIGPFTDDWEISLKNSRLNHLDFSNVTEAYFDFCGTNYSF